MNAKEMFEKLGYEQIENGKVIKFEKDIYVIEFDSNYKEITFDALDSTVSMFTLSFNELNAIHQQMKELGWIE